MKIKKIRSAGLAAILLHSKHQTFFRLLRLVSMLLGLAGASFILVDLARLYISNMGAISLHLGWVEYLYLNAAVVVLLILNHQASLYLNVLDLDRELEGKTIAEIIALCEGRESARRDDLVDYLALVALRDPRFADLPCKVNLSGQERAMTLRELSNQAAEQRLEFTRYAELVQQIVQALLLDPIARETRIVRYLDQ